MKGKIATLLSLGAVAIALASTAEASQSYTVRAGDSLWEISRRFGVSIDVLKATNHVSANKPIQIGIKLIIPSGKTSSRAAAVSNIGHTGVNAAVLRSAPSRSSRKLAVLERGTTVRVVGKSGDWRKVELDSGGAGYIYSMLIRSGPGDPSAGPRTDSTPSDSSREALIKSALASRGVRYRYGGTSRGGFDCSGFTRYVYARYGVSLPHSSRSQYGCGTRVSRSELKEGDLVFFHTTRRGISHVGIYIGDGNFVHASNHRRGVVVDSLSSAYYSSRYVGARRVK